MRKRYSSAQQKAIAALRGHGKLILHQSMYWTKKNPKLRTVENAKPIPLLKIQYATLESLFFIGIVRFNKAGTECFLNS